MGKKWEKFKKNTKESFSTKKEKVAGWSKNIGNKVKAWKEQKIFKKTDRKIEGKTQKTDILKEKLAKYKDKEESIKKIIDQLGTQEEKDSFRKKIEEEKTQLNEKIKENTADIAKKIQKKTEFKLKKEKSIEKINTYIEEKIKSNNETIEDTKIEGVKTAKELGMINDKLNEFTIDIEGLPSSAIKKYKEIRKNLEKNKVKLEKIIEKFKKSQSRYEKKNQKLENEKVTDVGVNKKERRKKKEKIGNKQLLLLKKFNKANPGSSIIEPKHFTPSNREDLERYITETRGAEATKQFREFINEEEKQDIGKKRDKILEDIDKRYGKTIIDLAYLISGVERMEKKIAEAENEALKEGFKLSLEPTLEEINNNYNDDQKLKAQEVIVLLRKEGIEI